MKASEPDLQGLRAAKIIVWFLFHFFTLGIFLIPHALFHYILSEKK